MKRINREKSTVHLSAFLALTGIFYSACVGEADHERTESDNIAVMQSPLWWTTGDLTWAGGRIRVCFAQGTQGGNPVAVPAAMRDRLRHLLEETWESAAAVDFFGWGNCSGTSGNRVEVRLDDTITGLGGCNKPADPTTTATRIAYRNAAASDKTLVHEFGHALGFRDENIPGVNPCANRNSGGTSLENEQDLLDSVMSQSACNSEADLSAWDILGLRRMYGMRDPGTIRGFRALIPTIQGGSTTIGTPIVVGRNAHNEWYQTWERPSTTSFMLQSNTGGTSRCLRVQGGATSNGFTPLESASCSGDLQSRRFRFGGMEWLAMGNRCIRAASSNYNAGLYIDQCRGGNLQKWDFIYGSDHIRLNGTRLCVTVPNGNTAIGTGLRLRYCDPNNENQRWELANGYVRRLSGDRCLHVRNNTTQNGNVIDLQNDCFRTNQPAHSKQYTLRGKIHGMNDQCMAINTDIGVRPCVADADNQTWEYYF